MLVRLICIFNEENYKICYRSPSPVKFIVIINKESLYFIDIISYDVKNSLLRRGTKIQRIFDGVVLPLQINQTSMNYR